jgi:uncharacterized membrane protein
VSPEKKSSSTIHNLFYINQYITMAGRKILIMALLAMAFFAFFSLQMAAEPRYDDAWWNASWHYRMKIVVNTSDFPRTNWPVEREINFTAVLQSLNVTGAFDNNSTRVVEYNASGSILHELPSQFDLADDFNASTKANGELVFILNGTTQNQTVRYFYVYFDTVQNGAKAMPSYPTQLNSTLSGTEAQINNSLFIFYLNTSMGESTSGLYRTVRMSDDYEWFNPAGAGEPAMEYVQITNGSQSFGFDLRNNISITVGPVRIRIRQTGQEILWNQPSARTNESSIVKEYYFYPNAMWIRIKSNITNTAGYSINRSSSVGITGFDVARAYNLSEPPSMYKIAGNETNPGSWIRGTYDSGGPLTGFIHINQSAGAFYATNTTSPDRIGISMNTTSIGSGESITSTLAMVFGHTVSTPSIMEDTKDLLISEINFTQYAAERWVLNTQPSTAYPVYSRNETIFVTANVTSDPWNITNRINATFDMGTISQADDQIIQLSYNSSYGNQTAGYKLFTGQLSLTNTSQTGYWNVTIKAYDISGSYLNESYYTFNVTSDLYTNLTIQNALGLPSRIIYAIADVKNFRQDTSIPGASINCSYGAIQVTNITDNGNGTYSINFTAPSTFGLYILNCSAAKDGSFGYDSENFTVEAAKTNVSISRIPSSYTASNVTLYSPENFIFNITLVNDGNSSAYSTNVTLSLPANWSYSPPNSTCGNIPISGSCLSTFNITIHANATPGNYYINVSSNWTNLDATTSGNSTSLNVTVTSHPLLNVPQNNLSVIMGPGNTTTAGTFIVSSIGNSQLTGISFTATGLPDFTVTFIPTSVASLDVTQNRSVQVNVAASMDQAPGIYEGVINVSSSNDGFDLLNLTVTVSGANVSITRQPQNFTANVTYYQNDTFVLHVTTNNTGNVTAFYSSINLSLPTNWTSNASSQSCGNLTRGSNCTADFLITVFRGTPSGSYLVNATTNWQDIGIGYASNTTSVNVTVLSNTILSIPQDQLSDNVSQGITKTIGYLALNSTGNDPVLSIAFNVSGFTNITISFTPTSIASLSGGSAQNVSVNVTVPLGYDPGVYNGTVNVTTGNDGYKEINISITVPQNGSWTMSPTYCEKVQTPATGYVCNVTVNNTGNVQLNFSIYPAASSTNMSNYSWTNITNFTIAKQAAFAFSVLYNVTGVAGQNWKISNYTIDPQEAAASPGSMILQIALNPNLNPLVYLHVAPASAEQTSYFVIYSNVSSQSGMGIAYVLVNVTRPDGTSDEINMTQLFWAACVLGSTTCWYANYSSGWGETILKGNYSVLVTGFDNSQTNETNTTTFQVYTKMLINFTAGSETYAQGDMGYFDYRSRDYNNTPLQGTNTTITLTNPNGNMQGIIFTTRNYTTGADGWTESLPYFTLTNDAPTGNYTATSFSTYYDSNASVTVNSSTQTSFLVQESTSQGIFADIATTVVWYPNSVMTFSINVYDSNDNPLDPDQLNLTVYAGNPLLNNIYLQADLSSAIVHKEGTGHYIVSYVMPSNTATGDYWAQIHVARGSLSSPEIMRPFRVSQGGPYDVRLRLIDNEVPRGDYLDFEIVVENMGEAGQDVDIDYWVSDGVQTWYSASEAIYTPPHQNVTALRNAYIFTNQNLGLHTLNLMVNYSYVSPVISKNATFLVTEASVQPPQPPGGPGPGGPAGGEGGGGGGGAATISIIEYPDELGIEAGVARYPNIRIKNTGDADATNVTISLSGIEASWFEIDNPNVGVLKPNETKIIPIKFQVPAGTKAGEFTVKLKVDAAGTMDQKIFILRIFTSRKDLIEFELARLKAKTDELELKANEIKEEYDVEDVLKLIKEIRNKITETEGYLSEEKYDAALGSIYAGWELYNRAAELLQNAQPKKVPELIPWWLIILIIVLVGIVLFLVLVLRKLSLNIKVLLRGRYTEAKTVAGIVRKEPQVENLRQEKEKLERMLSLMENQYKQGIIPKEAYDGLRASSEQKLKNLEERIRKELSV